MTVPGAAALAQIEAVEAEALAALERAGTAEAAEAARIEFLGRKGRLTAILRQVGSLPSEARRTVGARGNQARERIEAALAAWGDREAARRREGLAAARIDVTLPGRPVGLGRLHPLTQVIRQICGIFAELGFSVVEGPEVEWDYYNFEALNIPADHPARDMWDTFWIEPPGAGGPPMLLRTHTSPMQIRVLEQVRPPVRVVVPGKCYRYEATDASHESQFHQIEGLAVDAGVTFADLKGTLQHFARRMFGAERRVRFRCDYFPFVEPGVDMAIDCFACQGRGCRLCKQTGWLEILGAGMVHPDVLARVGIDPATYTGFAFGMGPARVAMLRHGIEDIRLFHGNDPRFLRQFP
jgi:phenylalanyl-tRNA synthetase alpha chain